MLRMVVAMVCCAFLAVPARAGEEGLVASAEAMQWFTAARFGMFIHWGPVSLQGTEIGWSRGGERRGIGGTGEVPLDVYDNLYHQFNPTRFDAKAWVKLAQDAGMKYLVFTTRHHDGFSEWDSAVSDYKITNSPFKRDVCRELADAAHAAGLKLGWYYSPPDWHHPDYRTARHAQFITYLHKQLEELCTHYGKIDIIWFDGLGGSAQDWDSTILIPMIRRLQPGVVINNRAGLPCDWDTPEQQIGGFNRTRPWETCMTIANQWAYKPNDPIKPLAQCLQTLVRCAGGDGNLLFNVGPMPTGEIEPAQQDRLREMGAWLKTHGETIYGTRGGPYKPTAKGACTYRGNTVYLHVFAWEADALVLPPLPRKVLSAKLLGGGPVTCQQADDALRIDVPAAQRDAIDTVIVLELDGPAGEIPPLSVLASKSVAVGCKTTASNVFQKMAQYGPEKALDDDEDTRWATDAGTHEAWLEIDLGREVKVGRVRVDESASYARTRRFALEQPDGDGWKPFCEGTTLGPDKLVTFPAVTLRRLRLHILEATEGPTLNEVQVFAAK